MQRRSDPGPRPMTLSRAGLVAVLLGLAALCLAIDRRRRAPPGRRPGLRGRDRGQRPARSGARRLHRHADHGGRGRRRHRAGPAAQQHGRGRRRRAPRRAGRAHRDRRPCRSTSGSDPSGSQATRRRHGRAGRRPHGGRRTGQPDRDHPGRCSATARSTGEAAVGDTVSAGDAVDLGLVDNAAPTIGDVRLRELPGEGCRERRAPSTAASASPSRRPASPSSRSPASSCTRCPARRWPTCCSSIGLALILFELFTAGVGVAGLVGAGCLVLGCYGLAALPTNPVGIGPDPVRDVRLRHRRADRRAPRLERHRHRVASPSAPSSLYDGLSLSWITLLVAIVGHGAGDDRRDARHGPQPVLDPDDRAGVDGRRGRHGASAGWPPTGSSPCVTRRGGPAPTGPPRSRPTAPVRVVSIDGLAARGRAPRGGGPGPPRPPLNGQIPLMGFGRQAPSCHAREDRERPRRRQGSDLGVFAITSTLLAID